MRATSHGDDVACARLRKRRSAGSTVRLGGATHSALRVPDVSIIVANQPDFPWLTASNPQVRQLIMAANAILASVAAACDAKVADVFTAFDGRTGLFLAERNGVGPGEGHPTNLGYRVIATAFEAAAQQ